MVYVVHTTLIPKKGVTISVIPKAIQEVSSYFVNEIKEVKEELAHITKGNNYHYWFEVSDSFVDWFKEHTMGFSFPIGLNGEVE